MERKGRGNMVYKQKHMINGSSMPVNIGVGLIIGWIITIVVTLAMATIISSGKDKEYLIGTSSIIAVILSSVVSAILVSKHAERNKMIYALISGIVYFVSLLCVNALFYNGTFTGVGYYALLILGASVSVGLICSRKSNRKIGY
jgi:putative membrane protein (TIGR04086 family)